MLKSLSFSYQEKDVINLVTKDVMLEKIKQDICLKKEVGVAKMETWKPSFKNVSKRTR